MWIQLSFFFKFKYLLHRSNILCSMLYGVKESFTGSKPVIANFFHWSKMDKLMNWSMLNGSTVKCWLGSFHFPFLILNSRTVSLCLFGFYVQRTIYSAFAATCFESINCTLASSFLLPCLFDVVSFVYNWRD
jgi:hypothetical protein